MSDWLATILPFVSDTKQSNILREHVRLLEAQRDDAIRELDKADSALANAKQEIAGLKRENDELKKKAHSLQPKAGLPEQSVSILQHLFKTDRGFSAEQISQIFNLGSSVGKYHLDSLEKKDLISAPVITYAGSPILFRITEAGRAYIVEHNLA